MAKEPAHVWAQRLCLAAQAGDKKALSALVEGLSGFIFSKVEGWSKDHDQLWQLARIHVWKAVLAYDPARGATFFSYVHFYVVKHALRQLTMQSASERSYENAKAQFGLEQDVEPIDDPEELYFSQERLVQLGKAAVGLNERRRSILIQTLTGAAQMDIAHALGVSHTTVQNDLIVVVRHLRKQLFGVDSPRKVRDRSKIGVYLDANKDKVNARRRELYAAKKVKA